MKSITAQKTATTEMIEVTSAELTALQALNPFISVSQHDKENHINKNGVIGYIAGDVQHIQMHEKDMKIIPNVTPDAWFVNKEFFDTNYKEVNDSAEACKKE